MKTKRTMTMILCLMTSALHGAVTHKGTTLSLLGGKVVLSQRGAQTVVRWSTHGVSRIAILPADDGIYPGSLSDAEVLGTVDDRVLVLSVGYGSRPNGGMHQCGAGTETMVRVISFSGKPHQTFEQLVESCWLTIDPGDVAWDPSAHTLSVERTTYSDEEGHTNRMYRVDGNGAVRLIGDVPADSSSQ
jgi:hypothetical protein